jgi:hypothetical protein
LRSLDSFVVYARRSKDRVLLGGLAMLKCILGDSSVKQCLLCCHVGRVDVNGFCLDEAAYAHRRILDRLRLGDAFKRLFG